MKITQRLKIMLKSILSLKMGEIATDKATLVWDGEGELEAGMEVFVIVDGEPVPAEDGDYTTEDGKVIVVAEGKVAEIKDNEAEVAPEEEPAEEPAEMAEENEEPAPADEPENTEEEPAEEDRVAALEEKVNAIVEAMNQFVNSIASLEARIAEVEGKLAKVEAPAAEPVDEEPIAEKEQKSILSLIKKK